MLKTKIKISYSSIEYLNYFFIIILISIISCKSGSSGKSETSESKEISDSIENYKDKIKKFNIQFEKKYEFYFGTLDEKTKIL